MGRDWIWVHYSGVIDERRHNLWYSGIVFRQNHFLVALRTFPGAWAWCFIAQFLSALQCCWKTIYDKLAIVFWQALAVSIERCWCLSLGEFPWLWKMLAATEKHITGSADWQIKQPFKILSASNSLAHGCLVSILTHPHPSHPWLGDL